MAITKWDEYLIHQAYDTMDTGVVEENRLLISCYRIDGTLHLTAGLGVYPKANTMDGYVCVRHEGVQHNLRLSRHVKGDFTDTRIGPLSVEVIEPLKRWGLYLNENDYDMGCSIEFEGRNDPYLYKKAHADLPFVHYTQAGRYKGRITLAGQEFDIGGHLGVRDRTWRVRGVELTGKRVWGGHLWIQTHFTSFSLTLVGTFWWDPNPEFAGAIIYDDNRVIPITQVSHRIEFVPGIRALSSMKLLLKCADGKDRVLAAKPISPALYLKGGGYDGKSLGMDRGPYHIEGEQWDVSQPADLGSEYFGTAGISEFIADFQLNGEPGIGILETSYCPDKKREYRPTW